MWQYIIPAISAIVVAALTSGGLWALVGRRADRNDAERKMLVGLAHDRIIHLGMTYIQRGEVTQDEYENLNDYPVCSIRENGRQRQCQARDGRGAPPADPEITDRAKARKGQEHETE